MQHDERRPDDESTQLNGLDRLTQRAALAVSRRGFLKRLSVLGAAVGIGMAATTKNADAACTEYYYKYRTTVGTLCGACYIGSYRGRSEYKQRSYCRYCNGSEICDPWSTYATGCQYC